MTAFFDAFWPNLAATLIGVALGVPIALYLNRQLSEYQKRFDTAELRKSLSDAIDVLIGACRYNAKVLDNIKELSLSGKVMRNPDLRITAWDVTGSMLSRSYSEPELLQMLSHHWLRLRRLEQLNEEIFAREVAGSLPPFADQELMLGFWGELHDNALSLSAHAKDITNRLEALKEQHVVGRTP